MKIKNIGFFERHFEKFLGGVALIVIGVSVYYFVFNTPNVVEINNQQVGPAKVDAIVYGEAQRLQQQLGSDQVADPLKNLEVPDYTANFVGKLGQPATPVSEFKIALGGPPIEAAEGPGLTPEFEKPYHQPDIPAPTIVAQRADMGAIDPVEVEAITDLKKIVGEQPPYDTAWVSVVGQFPMDQMVKELTREEDDTHRQIPPEWWHSTFAIVDVQLARQAQNPDGTWPADDQYDLVKPLPGKLSFRQIPRDPTSQQATEYLRLINQYRGVLIQQPFYELVGQPWTAPEPKDESIEIAEGDTKEQARELQRQMRLKAARLRIIEQQIDRLKAPRGGSRPTPGARPGGGFEGLEGVSGEFGEFAPPAARSRSRPSGANTILQRRIERLNEQADKAKQELRDLQEQYKTLTAGEEDTPAGRRPAAADRRPRPGAPYGGEFGEFGPEFGEFGPEFGEFGPEFGRPDGGADRRPRRNDDLNILAAETVDLWATDLGVEPGKTYRYKMRVTAVNILFNKPNMPEAQKQANAGKFLVDSGWSDWTDPIALEKIQHFFVMSASPQPEPGQANVEVWKFYSGQWLQAEFSIQPGDPIGGVTTVTHPVTGEKIQVDFNTGAYLVDIDFNYLVPARLGNLPRKTQMFMYARDGQLVQRRVDRDKADPLRQELQDKLRSGLAAVPEFRR